MNITGEQVTAMNSAVGMNKLLQISAGALQIQEAISKQWKR